MPHELLHYVGGWGEGCDETRRTGEKKGERGGKVEKKFQTRKWVDEASEITLPRSENGGEKVHRRCLKA
eukprot:760343-Hanusia_phi.AAC.3